MDYVSNWFLLAGRQMAKSPVRTAFVSTNSITQGGQPATLWRELYSLGVGIDFAHQSFSWKSEASGQAGVHVVIIGFSAQVKPPKRRMWIYRDRTSEAHEVQVTNINAYLLDAPNILIEPRREPLQVGTPKMDNGNKPTDSGFLSDLSEAEADAIRADDPIAVRYLRRLVGAQELINGGVRWCLWLVDAKPSDIRESRELSRRVDGVREMRASSTKKMTRADAAIPHLFQEIRQPVGDYIAVPRITSESRDYVPMTLMTKDVIINDKVSYVANGELWLLGILMSRPFNIWNKAISGRTRNDTLISNTITYNNFPFPELDERLRQAIAERMSAVVVARDNHRGASLADLYDPLAMPRDLVDAHQKLDREVLTAYGLKPTATESEILTNLFTRYSKLTEDLFTEEKPKKTRKKKV
jgi:hypothetical protein